MGRALLYIPEGMKDKLRKSGNKSCTLNKVSSEFTDFRSFPFSTHLWALRLSLGWECVLNFPIWTLTCPCCVSSRNGEEEAKEVTFSNLFSLVTKKTLHLQQDLSQTDNKSQETLGRCTCLNLETKHKLYLLFCQGSKPGTEREEGLIFSAVAQLSFLTELSIRTRIFNALAPTVHVSYAWDICRLLEQKSVSEQGEQMGTQ